MEIQKEKRIMTSTNEIIKNTRRQLEIQMVKESEIKRERERKIETERERERYIYM